MTDYGEVYEAGCEAVPIDELNGMSMIHAAGIAAVEAAAKREAWDEGHKVRKRRGKDGCKCHAWSPGECGCGLYGTGALISLAENPYTLESLAAAHTTDLREQSKFYAVKAMPDGVGE